MSSGTPAAADPEVDGFGREVHDPAQAATALLEGEPLVILRSDTADEQAGKVNALRAALRGRSIRVLRLDGTHPRGLSPLAAAGREADRAVLVVEHPDHLEPSTLEALRDVEHLQLVLVHREDALALTDRSTLEPASVRCPPEHLVAFDLDPERRRWRSLVGAMLITLTVGGLLAAAMLYVDPPWRSSDGERTTIANDISPPSAPATSPPTGCFVGRRVCRQPGAVNPGQANRTGCTSARVNDRGWSRLALGQPAW